MTSAIIDSRMRNIEKEKLKSLGLNLVEIPKNELLYEEISSHTDIFICKFGNNLVVEKSIVEEIEKSLNEKINIINGQEEVSGIYPNDIKYNVCIIGKRAIHNFKYTNKILTEKLKQEGYRLINVNQGYANCSIAVIDDNSCITADIGIYNALKNEKDLDILYINSDNLNINLLDKNGISSKKGFIGGLISRIDNKIFVSGDLEKLEKEGKIKDFIKKKKLEIIDFTGLDCIDYGGIIEI